MPTVSFKATIGFQDDLSFPVEVEGDENGIRAIYGRDGAHGDITEYVSDRTYAELEEELGYVIAEAKQ